MDNLINKIALQSEGLLRGNLEKALGDFNVLCKEVSDSKMVITLKIRLSKKLNKGYTFDSAIGWVKGLKRSDVTDKEYFDSDTPDMFDRPVKPDNPSSPGRSSATNKPAGKKKSKAGKTSDTMNAEKTLTTICVESCSQGYCCQCEKDGCKDRITPFGDAKGCQAAIACTKDCPRLISEKFTESALNK